MVTNSNPRGIRIQIRVEFEFKSAWNSNSNQRAIRIQISEQFESSWSSSRRGALRITAWPRRECVLRAWASSFELEEACKHCLDCLQCLRCVHSWRASSGWFMDPQSIPATAATKLKSPRTGRALNCSLTYSLVHSDHASDEDSGCCRLATSLKVRV